jgi:hypothetical protein
MKKSLFVWSALALLVIATACTKSSPSRPSDLSSTASTGAVTDASTGITITTPVMVSPTVNQQFKFADQPLTLTVKNAAQTGSSPLTYSFEVATDAAFANKVYSKDGVTEGSGGQTSLKIDTLAGPGAKNYFWRTRASTANTQGLYSSGRAFAIGPQVVIGAATLVAPAAGATLGDKGSLTVSNASVTGPAGQIVYRFEVSDSNAFTNLVFASSVNQTSGSTSASMTAKLVTNGNYFWRVQVSDPTTGVVGPYSTVGSFKFVPFDMTQAVILDNPRDLGSWAETSKVTSVDFSTGFVLVDFDKRDGPNRWPDVPFGSGDLQYTLGLCVNNGGTWYCSAVVQFWYGRDLEASAPAGDIGREWFYDGRWGPILGYQPAIGETVGVFAAAGNLRDASYSLASCPRVCERTNVAFVQWGTSATFR